MPAHAATAPIRIGVTDGPQAEILEEVKAVALSRGLKIELVAYRDGAYINRDLAAGRLAAASFQDDVAFRRDVKRHGYPLIEAAATVTLPMGVYSKKVTELTALKDGDTLAIPDDRAGTARALVLLQNYGLITFADRAGLDAGLKDIELNPHRYHIVALPAHGWRAAVRGSPRR